MITATFQSFPFQNVGCSSDQYAKFDPKKRILGLQLNPKSADLIDKKFIKTLDCIDMYDPVEPRENRR